MISFLHSLKLNKTYILYPLNGDYTKTFCTHEHYHGPYHIIITVKSSGYCDTYYDTLELNDKNIIIVNPYEKHIFRSHNLEKPLNFFSFNFYMIEYTPDFSINEFLDNYNNIKYIEDRCTKNTLSEIFDIDISDHNNIKYDEKNWADIKILMNSLEQDFLHYQKNSTYTVEDYNTKTLSFINYNTNIFTRFMNVFNQGSNTRIPSIETDLLHSIITYIEENITEKFSLEKLSKLLSYNPSYLCRFFKKSTGLTLNSYYNKIRLDKACRYLSTNNYSIQYIADILGFSSISHFCKNFKKFYGVTPTEYYNYHYN